MANSEMNNTPVSHASLKNSPNINDSMKSDMKPVADLKSVDSSKNVMPKPEKANRDNDGSSLSFRSPSNPQILPNYASK